MTVRASADAPEAIQVALADIGGSARGAAVPLTREWQHVKLPLGDLSPVTPPEVPHPWPLPIGASDGTGVEPGSAAGLAALHLSFGPGVFPEQGRQRAVIELQEVALEISEQARTKSVCYTLHAQDGASGTGAGQSD